MIQIIIAISLVLLGSAFFSSSETAFSNLQLYKLEAAQKEKRSKMRAMTISLKKNQVNALTTILIMNNIVNIAGTAYMTFLFQQEWGAQGLVYGTTIMTVAIIIFGEIVPKTLATAYPVLFAQITVVLLYPLSIIVKPIALILQLFSPKASNTTTEKELKQLVNNISEQGILEKEESHMIKKALDFDDIMVKKIMTQADDIDKFEGKLTYAEFKKFAKETSYSRIPVFKSKKPVGIILVSDFLKNATSKSVMSSFVKKDVPVMTTKTNLHEALIKLKKSKVNIAFIQNSRKEFVGLVSMEDLVEQIVGEIYDETDDDRGIKNITFNSVSVKGTALIEDVYENHLDFKVPKTDAGTVMEYVKELNSQLEVFVGLKVKKGHVTYLVESMENEWKINVSWEEYENENEWKRGNIVSSL